ncbi:MAG TPA: FGGY family carbohydrate kinase, partial [Halanaerobiales bacterium]|nr:FGGY family carbohydrate kinase [Halanaerobiales bacterium]
MDKNIFIGIDLGTTGMKIIMMQDNGDIIDKKYIDYQISSPKAGYAEQRPADWWDGLCKISRELIEKNSHVTKQIAGIGITGQMHTQVYLDENGRPLRDAITWMDQRCQSLVEEINKENRETIFEHTSNYLTTTYTAPHIVWVKRNQPDLYKKTDKILLAKDYLKYKLTGEMATDYSDAVGTLLFDVAAKKWSDEMFELFRIKKSLMPEADKSAVIIGQVT